MVKVELTGGSLNWTNDRVISWFPIDSLEESSGKVPSVLFIEEGEYTAEACASITRAPQTRIEYRFHHHQKRYVHDVTVKKPLSIYGAGRGKTTLVGFGLLIKGKKSDGIVEIEDLTIKGGGGRNGLHAKGGMNVIMRGCSVMRLHVGMECMWEYQSYGVVANGADISCDDLQVIGCGSSGVRASSNATITLSGQGTSIQGNGTDAYGSRYGLNAFSSSSKIQLVHPLTKEQISTNNRGDRNWGGSGTIEQVSE